MGAGLGPLRRTRARQRRKRRQENADRSFQHFAGERLGSARAGGHRADHKTILTNRSILELPEIPKTLIVVGAGAVGVEFASIYNSFGTQVTILEALPRVVPVEDEEISTELTKAFQNKGIQAFTSCSVESG